MSIATEPTEQKIAVQPFGKRSANRERIQQDEEELKNLLEKNVSKNNQSEESVEQTEENNDANLSAEEKSFKKRYGDLRRHSQQQQATLQKQIDELKQQLTASTNQQIKLPANEDELDSWMKQYPDVAKIVKTIAIKEAREQSAALEDRFRALDEREKLTAREKAELELLKIHPDFNQIRDTDDFHEWAEEQPQWVQKALYENDTDARAAARAIDLYKVDRNIGKPAPKKDKGAAESVSTRGARSEPSAQDTEGVMLESQVAKMSSREYEANQEAIAKAMRSGKFVYDLSGKAR
jgi:hypothetical protein